jgi:hypothetical protein
MPLADESELLTVAREAMWQAIDSSVELSATGSTPIQKKFKFETNADCLPDVLPAYSDLNAISIWPSGVTPEHKAQRTTNFPCSLDVNIWTREWVLATAERTYLNVIKAIFKARDPQYAQPLNTYVKMATGRHPRLSSVQFLRQDFDALNGGGARAILVAATISFDSSKDIYPR